MSKERSEARPWKIATVVLAIGCAVLGALLVLQANGDLDTTALAGHAGAGPATLAMGEFKGDASLAPELEKIIRTRMGSAGALSYSAPGVTGVTVGGSVTDKSAPDASGGTNIDIKVTLFLTKQPGAGLLGALSSNATVSIEAGAPAGEVAAMKAAVLDAAANGSFDDVVSVLAR